MILYPLFWDGIPQPNNGHAIGSQRTVQKKKKKKNNTTREPSGVEDEGVEVGISVSEEG